MTHLKILKLIAVLMALPPAFAQTTTTNRVLALDGSGDYMTVPSSSDLQNPTAITVESWIFATAVPSGNYSSFINKGDGASGASARTYEARWQNDGTFTFAYFFQPVPGAPDYMILGTRVPVNQWTHFAATFDSGSGSFLLFTNGVLAIQAAAPFAGRTIRQTTLPLVFGWTPSYPNAYASGYMGEIRLWSRARSAQEIVQDFSHRLSGSEAGLAGYWTFDTGTASDLTGHGHNGTFIGNASAVAMELPPLPLAARLEVGRSRFSMSQGFRLKLIADVNQTLRVEASTNFVDWQTIISFSALSGSVEYIDTSATNFTRRFYRVVSPQ